jgi:galactoside O-acetyltransferase
MDFSYSLQRASTGRRDRERSLGRFVRRQETVSMSQERGLEGPLDRLPFLSGEETERLGFSRVGEDVLIDSSARFYGSAHITIGSHVRIDAFCVITAGPGHVEIGNHVHIANGCSIMGTEGVQVEDFCGLSARATIFSTNDDYSGGALTNPTVPYEFRNVKAGRVTLRKHAILGCGSVVMPGVEIGVGASVGSLSYVNKSVPEFMVVTGNPIWRVGTRSRDLLQHEREFLNSSTRTK